MTTFRSSKQEAKDEGSTDRYHTANLIENVGFYQPDGYRMKAEYQFLPQYHIAKHAPIYATDAAPRNDTGAISSGDIDREFFEKINHFWLETGPLPSLPDVIRHLSSALPAATEPRMKPFVSVIPLPLSLPTLSSNRTSSLKTDQSCPPMQANFRFALLAPTSDYLPPITNLPSAPTALTESYAARLSARTLAPPPATVASDSDDSGRRKRRIPQQGRGRQQRGRSQASRITVANLVG